MPNSLDRVIADAFRNTVRGTTSPLSFGMGNDEAFIDLSPIFDGTPSNHELIVEVLRSNVPLTRELREALADTVADILYPMRGSRKKSPLGDPKRYKAAMCVMQLVDEGGTRDASIHKVADKYGIGESTLKADYYSLKEALDINASLYAE